MTDITNYKSARDWLRGQNRDVVTVFAVRAALRAWPFLSTVSKNDNFPRTASDIILPLSYGMATALSAGNWPDRAVDIDAAAAAAAAARAAADSAAADSAAAAAAARAAADSAAVRAARAAAAAAARAAAFAAAFSAAFAAAVWQAFNVDVAFIEAGRTAFQLTEEPLWPGGKTGLPQDIQEHWQALRDGLLDLNENWEVWTDWYEARLVGGPMIGGGDLEIAKIKSLEKNWKKGAATANKALSEIIEEYKRKHPPKPTSIPPQKSATIKAVWKGDIVTFDLTPVDTDLSNELAQATLTALKAEFIEFLETCPTDNMDQRIISYIQSTNDLIPGSMPDTAVLQRLALRENRLIKFIEKFGHEWNDITLIHIEDIVAGLSKALDQFPARREFKRSMLEIDLKGIPVAEREAMISRLLSLFNSPAGRRVVDNDLTARIRDIGSQDRLDNELNLGTDADLALIIHADQLESMNNTLKEVAEAITDKESAAALIRELEPIYVQNMGKGIKDGVAEAGYEDGKTLGKVGIRAKAGTELAKAAAEKSGWSWPDNWKWISSLFRNNGKTE